MTWMRRLSIVLVLLAGALAGAAMLLPRLLDADTLRTMLILAARHHTGRELAVGGDIHFALLPRPALVLPKLALADAAGFGPEPFASVEGARINLRLWPLLQGRLVMASVQIDRPQLRLTVDAAGRTNWADLLPPAPPSAGAPAPSSGAGMVERLAGRVAVGQFEVRAGDVLWTDRRSGRWARLHDLDLSLQGLDPAAPLPLAARGVLEGGDPPRRAEFDLAASVRAGGDGAWHAPDLRLDARLGGAPLREPLALRMTADARVDPGRSRLRLRRLALAGESLQVRGELTAARGDDAVPVAGAQLQIERLDARALAGCLGAALATADPAALTQTTGSLELGIRGEDINIARLDLRIDDAHWRGSARLGPPGVGARFALETDRLDLDRYLPTPAASPAGLLRRLARLDLDGTLDVATLTVHGLRFDQVGLGLRAADGHVALQPLRADLYGGRAEATVQVDARMADPALRFKLAVEDAAAGPLLAALTGREPLQGRLTLASEATAAVASGAAFLRSLRGTARLDLRDGVLEGVNVERAIGEARAAGGRGKPAEACDAGAHARISALHMSGPISDGVWRSEDLFLEQQRRQAGHFYRLTGAGTLDLPTGTLDYRLTAAAVRRDGATAVVQEAPLQVRVQGRPGEVGVWPQLGQAVGRQQDQGAAARGGAAGAH
jgi:AsmA protein